MAIYELIIAERKTGIGVGESVDTGLEEPFLWRSLHLTTWRKFG
jgi:hypothetical protein